MVVLIIILLVFLLIISWILFSTFIFEIDTRIPHAGLRWRSIGYARIWYDEEWWLGFRVLFFRKKLRLSEIHGKKSRDRKQKPKKQGKKASRLSMQKAIRVVKTFKVRDWQLAIDTGDYTTNAKLYPANFFPYFFRHIEVNFLSENYFYIKVENNAWRILYAFIR